MGQQLMSQSLSVTLSTSLTYGLKHLRQTMCRVVVRAKRKLMSCSKGSILYVHIYRQTFNFYGDLLEISLYRGGTYITKIK